MAMNKDLKATKGYDSTDAHTGVHWHFAEVATALPCETCGGDARTGHQGFCRTQRTCWFEDETNCCVGPYPTEAECRAAESRYVSELTGEPGA